MTRSKPTKKNREKESCGMVLLFGVGGRGGFLILVKPFRTADWNDFRLFVSQRRVDRILGR